MSEPDCTVVPCQSPPPSVAPAHEPEDDARARLIDLARKLTQKQNRSQLIEYLRLRRSLR